MKWVRKMLYGAVGLLAFLVMAQLIHPYSFRFLPVLATGWFEFVRRAWPRTTMNWSGIGFALLTALIAIALVNWLGRSLFKQARNASTENERPWKLGYAVAMLGALVLAFLISLAGGGLATSVRWLSDFNGPTLIERGGVYREMREMHGFASELLDGAQDCEWNYPRFLAWLQTRRDNEFQQHFERFGILPLTREEIMDSVLVFGRNPQTREAIGYSLITSNDFSLITPQSWTVDEMAKGRKDFEPVLTRFLREGDSFQSPEATNSPR